ncbi:hypothetical protein [Rhizobium metallidurans]|uniref:Uncharacterized protein n=1 Tax=Rhizobium metallidurans TaxID=1265931 RepID=A0A7W6CQU7_9HYPH|nr:hypothetical protein [Rhizobium metallidurans]MBB3965505.1 hypothetical protein [Rhizobium metallidurans]
MIDDRLSSVLPPSRRRISPSSPGARGPMRATDPAIASGSSVICRYLYGDEI